jgi:alpha-L-rhamnosidase
MFTLGALIISVAAASLDLRVSNLRCNYLVNPLGIDEVQPRFTWEVDSASPDAVRGLQQLSYRVTVFDAADHATADAAPVWDSGLAKMPYIAPFVTYAGAPLLSGRSYVWSVELNVSGLLVTSRSAVTSSLASPAATFSMGMLSRGDWTGKFITAGKMTDACPWFRKEFSLDAAPAAPAQLMVASIGYCDVTVNGEAVTESVLNPSISYLPGRVLYRTYEVAHLLKAGANAIGLWASPGQPRSLLSVRFPDSVCTAARMP